MLNFPEHTTIVNNHATWIVLLLISSIVLMFIPNSFVVFVLHLMTVLLSLVIIIDQSYANGYESGSYETMDYMHYSYEQSHMNEMRQAELLAVANANVTLPPMGDLCKHNYPLHDCYKCRRAKDKRIQRINAKARKEL